MLKNQKNPFIVEEQARLHKRVVRRITAMSPKQRIKSMVRAGIYTKNGHLTKRFGG